jgi:hypothetical protein
MLEVQVPDDSIRIVEDSRITVYALDNEGDVAFHVEIVCGGESSPDGLIIDVYDKDGVEVLRTIALMFPEYPEEEVE